jgi:hypothetical protein
MSILDEISDGVATFFDALVDFAGEHPFLTMLIVVALFLGGCEVAFKVHIVSSATKLMPY